MTDDKKQVATVTSDPFIQMVERLSQVPDLNPDTVQKFLDMQMQVRDRNAKEAFYEAMNRVQKNLPAVLPNSRNEQTSSAYADLKAVSNAIKPVYAAEGFSASFWEGKPVRDGYIRVEGLLRHRDGHSEPYSLELPPDKAGIKGQVNKTDVHAAGSTFTYGRRYLTCMMFDVVVGPDTDGNAPKEPISEEQVADLEALITEIGLPPSRKAKFMNLYRIKSLEQMAADDYDDAIQNLKQIQAQLNADPDD